MQLDKWRTSVLGAGPWIVSDTDDPNDAALGTFRHEEDADIFMAAKILTARGKRFTDDCVFEIGTQKSKEAEAEFVSENELPDDITDEQYDWWYDRSYINGVRVGPKIPKLAKDH